MRKKLVAGNWKMHGTRAMAGELVAAIARDRPHDIDVAVFPPLPYVAELAVRHGDALGVGAQDLSGHAENGAHTGDVAASMLVDVGCAWVLAGHSERRRDHREDNALVATKFAVALTAGLVPVLCVGETLAERESDRTEGVVAAQLDAVLDVCGVGAFAQAVIAYEPVWAIGTGRAAQPEQAQAVHAHIREILTEKDDRMPDFSRLVYGGSVKPGNAAELIAQPDIDGFLVGGASLDADAFISIGQAVGETAG